MQTTSFQCLIGSSAVGTFQLQRLLDDHCAEDQANAIQRMVFETLRKTQCGGSPAFQFRQYRKHVVLEIRQGAANGPVERIDLTGMKDQEEMLKGLKNKPTRPKVKSKRGYHRANFHLSKFREALIPYKANLTPVGRQQLEEHLHYFESHPGEAFSYDLDANEEGITIVTYRVFQRYAALTLFYAD